VEIFREKYTLNTRNLLHKRIRKLEKVYIPQEQERIFVVFSWPKKGDSTYEGDMKRAIEQLRKGQRVIAVPQDGLEELKRIENKIKSKTKS
jgi:hypothetical protein